MTDDLPGLQEGIAAANPHLFSDYDLTDQMVEDGIRAAYPHIAKAVREQIGAELLAVANDPEDYEWEHAACWEEAAELVTHLTRNSVEAAYPIIERAVRERVAAEIEAAAKRETKGSLDYYEIYISEAVRIARGDSDGAV